LVGHLKEEELLDIVAVNSYGVPVFPINRGDLRSWDVASIPRTEIHNSSVTPPSSLFLIGDV
jgi:hypothetical protein